MNRIKNRNLHQIIFNGLAMRSITKLPESFCYRKSMCNQRITIVALTHKTRFITQFQCLKMLLLGLVILLWDSIRVSFLQDNCQLLRVNYFQL